MERRRRLQWLRLSRWFAAGLCAGGVGCSGPANRPSYPSPPPMIGAAPAADGPIQRVRHDEPAAAAPKELPITLDAVLHLAEQHNPRIAQAREKLNESHLTMDQGATGWIPNVYAGLAYYRHEGGIQNFQGDLIHSSTGAVYPGLLISSELDLREGVFQLIDLERKMWQNKAELSQVNNEVLLEAGQTYYDLLAARRGEALALEIEKYEKKLLDRAERAAKTQREAAALVETIKATLDNRYQLASRLRQQGNAASARLVYLLGLPPGTCLKPVDSLSPIDLIDVTLPPCDLIARAYTNGPAVREMEGVIGTVAEALEKTYSPHNLLPSIQANLCEGPFGAGPGASLAWDNRFDFGLNVRWNLTSLHKTESKRNVIRSKQAQAMYSLDEIKNKLAAGVSESRDSIYAGREQIGLASSQIRHADESYRVSERRMEEGLSGPVPNEVLAAIRGLEQAHFNHLQAIQAHNKAQVRLLMLLGGGCHRVVAPEPKASVPPPMPMLPEPRKAEPKKEPDAASKDKDQAGLSLPPIQ